MLGFAKTIRLTTAKYLGVFLKQEKRDDMIQTNFGGRESANSREKIFQDQLSCTNGLDRVLLSMTYCRAVS